MVDGGSGAGVLALSGLLAAQYHALTLGFTPLEGIASMSPRDLMVILKQFRTYQEREVLVGTLPDVIVAVGGGEGARRECEHTLRHGGYALMLNLKDAGPTSLMRTWRSSPIMVEAYSAKPHRRLRFCRSIDAIPDAIDELLAILSPQAMADSRRQRDAAMERLLKHGPLAA